MNKLQEIREALEAATPGPWKVFVSSVGRHEERLIATAYDHPQLHGSNGIVNHAYGLDGEFVYIAPNDAELIAHTPEYLSYLLQLVETQREALEFYAEEGNYLEHIIGWGPNIPVVQDGGNRAREALEGLGTL